MDFGLKGKTAVVSGSTAGIGFAIAAALAAEGARVIVNGRTEARVATALQTFVSSLRMPMSAAFPLTSVRPRVWRASCSKFRRRTFW